MEWNIQRVCMCPHPKLFQRNSLLTNFSLDNFFPDKISFFDKKLFYENILSPLRIFIPIKFFLKKFFWQYFFQRMSPPPNFSDKIFFPDNFFPHKMISDRKKISSQRFLSKTFFWQFFPSGNFPLMKIFFF